MSSDLTQPRNEDVGQQAGGVEKLADAAETLPDTPGHSASSPAWELPGQRYHVLSEIGRGGMGVVLRVFDADIQRPLAIKVMLERATAESEARFLEEARITGQLQHPGIAPVHEIGRLADGRPYFSMKLIEGRTLAGLLQQRTTPQIDLPRFLKIFEQVAQTLAYAHSQGIIHRDLKPSNVMVGAFGEVQVMDWGLARRLAGVQASACLRSQSSLKAELQHGPAAAEAALSHPTVGDADTEIPSPLEETRTTTPPHDQPAHAGRSPDTERLTQAGQVLGTPAYMPPEQARGHIDALDERSDVFGLGAVLCQILTRQPPYVGRDLEEVYRRAQRADLDETWPRLANCGADADLIAIAQRCLAQEPQQRYSQAGELAAAITAHLAGVQERLRQAELQRAHAETRAFEERKRRKMQGVMVASLMLLVALGGIGSWWVREQSIRKQERAVLTVDGALQRLVDLQRRALWKQGEALLDQAADQVGSEAEPMLVDRLDVARANLRFLATLDRLRQEKSMMVDGKMVLGRANSKYVDAFLEFGLDILNGDIGELARELKDSPVRDAVIAVLDDWAAHAHKAQRQRLDQITAAVTGEGWREELSHLADKPNALRQKAQETIKTPASPALCFRLAGYLENAGQDGLSLLESACRRYPSDFWLHFERGVFRGLRKQYDRAVGSYQAALAVQPENVAAWNNLGGALKDKRDLEGAIACYKRAIELDSLQAMVHNNLGIALHDKRDLEAAIACYHKAIQLDPKLAEAHTNLGNALRDKQDVEAAIACHNKALDLNPNNAAAHNNLGLALHEKRDFDGAIACYNRSLQLDPNEAGVHHNIGFALYHKKDVEGAMACYRRALALNPTDARTHNSLGIALRTKRDLQGAIACYQQAIELDSKYAKAHYNLGLALYDKRDLDGAIACFRRAIEIDAKYANAHHNLGHVLYVKRDLEGAMACFKRVLELDPNHPKAHHDLGHVLRDMHDVDAAIACFKRAIELQGQDANIHYNLGIALQDKHDREGAIACYRKAIELNPKFAEAHCNLGNALRRQGAFREAFLALTRGHELGSQRKNWSYPSAQRVDDCRRLLSMEAKMAAILAGESKPADAKDLVAAAEICTTPNRGLFSRAVQFYLEAFAAEPDLASLHGFSAAESAVLAAAGHGKDTAKVSDTDRVDWRRQALAWLREELAALAKTLEGEQPSDSIKVERTMQHWLRDLDLASVRDEAALAKLPADEQTRWRQFWADVAATRGRAEGSAPSKTGMKEPK